MARTLSRRSIVKNENSEGVPLGIWASGRRGRLPHPLLNLLCTLLVHACSWSGSIPSISEGYLSPPACRPARTGTLGTPWRCGG